MRADNGALIGAGGTHDDAFAIARERDALRIDADVDTFGLQNAPYLERHIRVLAR